jgi:acyl-coenzyme A thioesterase PaaI-like protein
MKIASRLEKILQPGSKGRDSLARVLWDRLKSVPGGRRLYSRLLGRTAPYSGSINARVLELKPGYAKVELRDRPSVRNHLDCVHAIALANLAELCGNVGIAYSLPSDARFIVAGLTIEYVKKARGTIVAESRPPLVLGNERREVPVEVEMRNDKAEIVARATLRTLIGPATPHENGRAH